MRELIEILKGDHTAVGLVALGWVARELVALRRSTRDQGKRIGALAAKMARCEAALNIQPAPTDGGS